ncbi:50S ribosomal protein L10 [Robbsia sp. KACC 23696]|uniref:50S ribosomal protein L10 n=1 Tax=Robbsia sp. KACC 23696 TaxID=3149231 RepID=UPI00325C2BD0
MPPRPGKPGWRWCIESGVLTVPLNREDKQAVVAEVVAQVAKAQSIVLAEYRGIAVGDLTKLRAQAREQKVYLRVLKNTLARRAVEGTPFAPLAEQMTGPLIYSVSEDAVAAAKVISDFAKSNDKLVIRSGSFEGQVLDKAGVQALAAIPSREVLLAQLLGVMQAPVSAFARGLAALAAKNAEGAPAAAEAAADTPAEAPAAE